MLTIIAIAYVAVLTAELAGDRLLYTLSALASRFRPGPVLVGAALASSVKMGVAVAFGHFIGELPPPVIIASSVVAFAMMGLMLLRETRSSDPVPVAPDGASWRGAATAFGVVLVTEWGDVAQVTAAMLVARYGQLGAVWLGGSLAMATKALLGAALGVGLRRWLPRRALRLVSVAVFFALAIAALLSLD